MDPDLWFGLGCLLVSFFFSLTEQAFLAYSLSKLEVLIKDDARKRKIDLYLERQDEMQLTSTVLNILANIGFVLIVSRHVFAKTLDGWAFARSFGYALLGVLLVGELIPRAWGRHYAERIVLHASPFLHKVTIALSPFTKLLILINKAIGRLFGSPVEGPEEFEIEHEIRSVVAEGEKEGALQEDQKEMIQSIVDFGTADVNEIMTPRTDMVSIEASSTVSEAREIAVSSKHSRIPVYDGDRDNVVGVILVKDLLEFLGNTDNGPLAVRKIMHDPFFVPETKNVGELLRDFRRKKQQMAIVLDEYGGTAGVITIEDILEEIVGDIVDEYDVDVDAPLKRISESIAVVDGRMHLDDLNEELGTTIPEDPDFETISGFLLSRMGRVPATGEQYVYEGIEFAILEADPRKIGKIKMTIHSDGASRQ